MQQKTIDVLRALWARQANIPTSIWDEVLWLDSQYSRSEGRAHQIFGITRGGIVRWEQDKKVHEGSLQEFMHLFPGTLDEREVRRIGKEILLLTIPPGEIRVRDLLSCQNTEIRRRLLSRAGNKVFLRGRGTRVIAKEGCSRLIQVNPRQVERPFYLLEVRDATSGERYLLRVPTTMRSCREAVAWTFGLRPEEYQPIKET